MQLSRRNMLGGIGAATLLAAFNPSFIGSEVVVSGYLKPYGVMGKYLFSATPLHCLECFKGDESQLMVVELDKPHSGAGKVRISGVLKAFNAKTQHFAQVLKDAKLVKNTFV